MKSKQKKFEIVNLIKLTIVLTTILIIAGLFPRGESLESEFKVGDIWSSRDLIAPLNFPILKYPEEYEKEIKEAENSVLPVFEIQDTIIKYTKETYSNINQEIKSLIQINNLRALSDTLKSRYSLILDSLEIMQLIHSKSKSFWDDLDLSVLTLIDYSYNTGLLDRLKSEIEKDSIYLRRKNKEKKVSKNDLLDRNDVKNFLIDSIYRNYAKGDVRLKILSIFFDKYLLPNILFNETETELAREQSRIKVSKNIGIVSANEKIVSRNQKITADIKRKLDSYKIFKLQQGDKDNALLQYIGKSLHVASLLLILGIYIFLFRKKVYNNLSRIIIISLILLLVSFIAYIPRRIDSTLPLEYLMLISSASMLITIIFDSRLGFYVTVIMSLIAGGIQGNDYSVTFINFIAGALAVYSVRDLKTHSQIFRSIFFIFAGYSISTIALGLERVSSIENIGLNLLFASFNSIISPVITYGLVYFFEKSFNITTDLILVELTNLNHPLLQELRNKAPGTFHHSINISMLAETAAQAIGANSILAKAGALYHDIGKIIEPNYFIENVRDEKSEHEDLDPIKSAQIILKHVEEGIYLARKYRLPQEIIDFIPMHHGTTQVQYFLNVAKKLKEKIDEDMFRYPGPKPNSKETAIVMLADASESIARSLEIINEETLNEALDELFRKRLFENQLDESNLTMKELKIIKVNFINTLLGIYHQRIEYPQL